MLQILIIMLLYVTNVFSSDSTKYNVLKNRAINGYFRIKPFQQELDKFSSIPKKVASEIQNELNKTKNFPLTNCPLLPSRQEGYCYQQFYLALGGIGCAMVGCVTRGFFGNSYPKASLIPFGFSAAAFSLMGTVEILKRASLENAARDRKILLMLEQKIDKIS